MKTDKDDLVLSISKNLSRRYGADISHTAVVRLLEQEKWPRSPKAWSEKVAMRLSIDHKRNNRRMVDPYSSDVTVDEKRRVMAVYGYDMGLFD